MARAVWKGAITFGLVHVPVNLYPGTQPAGLDFDLLDRRDFAPIGYKRVNKRTGEEVPTTDTVRGYEYEPGEYVVMSDEDFRQANVKSTQTIEIEAFVPAERIPALHFDTPYYLEPGKRGEKGYALLRETLRRTQLAGLGRVVLRRRQHLAVVLPQGPLLVMNTLRYADEIRSARGLSLPDADAKAVGVSQKELDMAVKLVEQMADVWEPERYRDAYRKDLLARIEQKVKRGETHVVTPPSDDSESVHKGAQVIDLMAMLRRSLERKPAERSAPAAARRAATPATKSASGAESSRRAAHGRRRGVPSGAR